VEPQLREPPGAWCTLAPGEPPDGRGSSHRRPLRGHQELELMEPINIIEGAVTHLPRNDVDTDQIIPAKYLKRVERTGYGEFLLEEWRKQGLELPKNPILVTG